MRDDRRPWLEAGKASSTVRAVRGFILNRWRRVMILLHMDGNLPDPLLHISIISDARLKPFLDKDLRAVSSRSSSKG